MISRNYYLKGVDDFSWCVYRALETSKIVSKIYKSIEIKNIKSSDNSYSSKLGGYSGQ